MGTRERDQTTTHQPLLSSLVVRPTDSGGGAGGGGSDYEPGEVRGPDRFSDKPGLSSFSHLKVFIISSALICI